MRHLLAACLAVLLAASGPIAFGGEDALDAKRVQDLVKQLSSDEFDAREEAEAKLKTAGAAAIPMLEKFAAESEDMETRTRLARALDVLRMAAIPEVASLSELAPQDTIFLVHVPRLRDGVQALRTGSVAGKLYDNPAFTPTRTAVGAFYEKLFAWSERDREFVYAFMDRYGGPFGLTFMNSHPDAAWPAREDVAVLFGPTGAEADKHAEALSALLMRGSPGHPQKHRGAEFRMRGEMGRDGLGRFKNVVTFGSNLRAMQSLIDGILDRPKGRLEQAEPFTRGRAEVGGPGLAELYFSMPQLLEQAGQRLSQRDRKSLEEFGLTGLAEAHVTLDLKDGLCVERAICRATGERRGLLKWLNLPAGEARFAALAPPEALAFVSLRLDAQAFHAELLNAVAVEAPRDVEQYKGMLEKLGLTAGLKVEEQVLGALKGEAALWLARSETPGSFAPDWGGAFEARDAASAQACAEGLKKLFAATGDPELVARLDLKGRAGHAIARKPDGKAGGIFPYAPAWCADGTRVFVGSSQAVLEKLLERIDAKQPGLDAQPDYRRLLEAIPAAERGGIVYVNAGPAANWLYGFLRPIVVDGAPEDYKELVAALPADFEAWAREVPGTLLSVAGSEHGIRLRSAGGLPVSGLVAAAALGSVPYWNFRYHRMRVEAERRAAEEQKAAQEAAEKAAQKEKEKQAQEVKPPQPEPNKKE
ncbi:MAG: hypothetical protein M5U26_03640 [Planctomycetota bacterium]|nr:hypothetical protein [Planctomycetota bacterium]